jgi:gamma-glutamyltranspeptidase/glutathione hydrolase
MSGAITASSQEAADAGVSVLRAGGNAVDAAVAAALATCVADPSNVGLGGYGGFMLVAPRGAPARCIAFPLCAPASLSPDTLTREYPSSGPPCSSVPNVVAGIGRAAREFGTLPWATLVEPAIALARNGVTANMTTRRALDLCRGLPFVAECFLLHEEPTGRETALTFRQPALAATLASLAERGPDWFYEGPLGGTAQRAAQEAGSNTSLDDWRRYDEAVQSTLAPTFECNGLRMFAAPLDLSGSPCLFAMFAAASRASTREGLIVGSALADLAHAMASVWQYRFAAPSGNELSDVDITEWVDRALKCDRQTSLAPRISHTAHLNAVDGDGTMVALTFTHGHAPFGGRWAIPASGVIMNAGMHNFTASPVVEHNGRVFGVSNMTPTIAVDDEDVSIAIGCPGARRIPSNIAMALAWHRLAGYGLQQAVSAGRVHAEDHARVSCETARLGGARAEALRRRFRVVEDETGESYYGPLTAIRYAPTQIEIGLDDRLFKGFGARPDRPRSGEAPSRGRRNID